MFMLVRMLLVFYVLTKYIYVIFAKFTDASMPQTMLA